VATPLLLVPLLLPEQPVPLPASLSRFFFAALASVLAISADTVS
jgi:hypothetical protein